jgi:fructose-bisphosphate aldolase class II
MPLVHMGDMLRHAYRNRFAIGAFDVTDLDSLLRTVDTAENTGSPLILGLDASGSDPRGFELLAAAAERAAERTPIPAAIHLISTPSLASAMHAINLGCTSVRAPVAGNSPEESIARTQELVQTARSCGVSVEGSLATASGSQGPEDARHFVAESGVDCLAVEEPTLDLERLIRLNAALGLPLALNPRPGVDNEDIRRSIRHGVSKIRSADLPAAQADQLMNLWGCAGRAQELLDQCRPQRIVEHVILYNLEGLDAAGVRAMMEEGRRVLARIPGVRRVFTGDAVQEGAAYRHCWVVRFSDPGVIDSYREHPAHQAFADQRFRPHAGGRVSIDYAEICA